MTANVSVIATVHPEDDVSLLKSSVHSVLHQTVSVQEIIIVDASCRADVRELINSFSGDFHEIQYVDAHNEKSTVVLMEKGARLAHNEWLAFISPSEVWLTDKIEEQLKTLDKFECTYNYVVLSEYYVGELNSDVPELIDAHLYNRSFDWVRDSNLILLEYEPWLFSGILLHKMFFLELVEKFTRQTAWAFLGNIFQFGKVIFLHRAYFIRKNISSSNRKQKELQEKCDALAQLKELILFNFGQSYWNDMIRGFYKDGENFNVPELNEKILGLFDFGLVHSTFIEAVEENKDINSCFFKAEMECFRYFCNSHKHIGCYGAGRFAKWILHFIQKQGFYVDCMIVSDSQRNASTMMGIQIYERSEVDLNQLDGIILAMDLRVFPNMKIELQSQYCGDLFTITHSFYALLQSK